MKLRFRKNSLRLRLNQRETQSLTSGAALVERVWFPGGSEFSYLLLPVQGSAEASFQNGVIRIGVPQDQLRDWEGSDSIGVYLEFPTETTPLKVAIEKDLECVDGPEEERDPFAFPRAQTAAC